MIETKPVGLPFDAFLMDTCKMILLFILKVQIMQLKKEFSQSSSPSLVMQVNTKLKKSIKIERHTTVAMGFLIFNSSILL